MIDRFQAWLKSLDSSTGKKILIECVCEKNQWAHPWITVNLTCFPIKSDGILSWTLHNRTIVKFYSIVKVCLLHFFFGGITVNRTNLRTHHARIKQQLFINHFKSCRRWKIKHRWWHFFAQIYPDIFLLFNLFLRLSQSRIYIRNKKGKRINLIREGQDERIWFD